MTSVDEAFGGPDLLGEGDGLLVLAGFWVTIAYKKEPGTRCTAPGMPGSRPSFTFLLFLFVGDGRPDTILWGVHAH